MKKYADEIEELDDPVVFNDLQAEKRNKELLKVLNKISETLANNTDKRLISEIIKHQEDLVTLIKNIKSSESSENSDFSFVSLTEAMCKDIIESNTKLINTIENRLLPDTFTLIKNNYGITESVKVNYKTAKFIS